MCDVGGGLIFKQGGLIDFIIVVIDELATDSPTLRFCVFGFVGFPFVLVLCCVVVLCVVWCFVCVFYLNKEQIVLLLG